MTGASFFIVDSFGNLMYIKNFLRSINEDKSILRLCKEDNYGHQVGSLGFVLDKDQTIRFLTKAICDEMSPIELVGYNVRSELTSLLVSGMSPHSVFMLLEQDKVSDIVMRTMMLSVALGAGIEDDYSFIRLRELFPFEAEIRTSESIFEKPVDDLSVAEKKLAIDQTELICNVYHNQENWREVYAHSIKQNKDSLKAEKDRVKYDFALEVMRSRGIQIDLDKLNNKLDELSPIVWEVERGLVKAGFASYKKKDRRSSLINKDIEKIAEAIKSSKRYRKNKKGEVSLKAFDFRQSGIEPLVNYGNRSNEIYLMQNIIPSLKKSVRKSSLIHTNIKGYSTTGRVSCKNPNLMGIPNSFGIKEVFRAREDHVFLSADFDSVEMRVFAQVLYDIVGRSRLASMYRKDPSFDPHAYLASEYLKITYEEAMDRKGKDSEFDKVRKIMKVANFGFMGGASVDTFARELLEKLGNSNKKEAQEIFDFYFEVFPEVQEYLNIMKENIKRERGSSTIFLERSDRVIGKRNISQSLNNMVQGIASDGGLLSLYEITKKGFSNWSSLYQSRPLLYVHDEIVLEIKENDLDKKCKELSAIMCSSMEKFTPRVKASVEIRVSKTWDKGRVIYNTFQ